MSTGVNFSKDPSKWDSVSKDVAKLLSEAKKKTKTEAKGKKVKVTKATTSKAPPKAKTIKAVRRHKGAKVADIGKTVSEIKKKVSNKLKHSDIKAASVAKAETKKSDSRKVQKARDSFGQDAMGFFSKSKGTTSRQRTEKKTPVTDKKNPARERGREALGRAKEVMDRINHSTKHYDGPRTHKIGAAQAEVMKKHNINPAKVKPRELSKEFAARKAHKEDKKRLVAQRGETKRLHAKGAAQEVAMKADKKRIVAQRGETKRLQHANFKMEVRKTASRKKADFYGAKHHGAMTVALSNVAADKPVYAEQRKLVEFIDTSKLKKGVFSGAAHKHHMSTHAYAEKEKGAGGLVGKRANLALAFEKMRRKK